MFNPFWEHKRNEEYIGQKFTKIGTAGEVHTNCICIDGSVVYGIWESNLFGFGLDERPGFEIFWELEIKGQNNKKTNLFRIQKHSTCTRVITKKLTSMEKRWHPFYN